MGRLLERLKGLEHGESIYTGTDATITVSGRHIYGGKSYSYRSPRFGTSGHSETEAHQIAKDSFGYELRVAEMYEDTFTPEVIKEIKDRFASLTKS